MDNLTIYINEDITEQVLMEDLLNKFYSGVSVNYIYFVLSVYAFEKRWEVDKLFYYTGLFK